MDQRRQAGGEYDAALLPSVPLKPGAASAEPAGLKPGQFVAAADSAQTDRQLVADELAATSGEDRRAAGEACPLLLASPGGRPSESPEVQGDGIHSLSGTAVALVLGGGDIRFGRRTFAKSVIRRDLRGLHLQAYRFLRPRAILKPTACIAT